MSSFTPSAIGYLRLQLYMGNQYSHLGNNPSHTGSFLLKKSEPFFLNDKKLPEVVSIEL